MSGPYHKGGEASQEIGPFGASCDKGHGRTGGSNMKHTAKWAALWSMAVLGEDRRPGSPRQRSERHAPRNPARAQARVPVSARKLPDIREFRERIGAVRHVGDAKVPMPKARGARSGRGGRRGRPSATGVPSANPGAEPGETKDTASHRRVARVVPRPPRPLSSRAPYNSSAALEASSNR